MRKSLLIISLALFLTNCEMGASLWDNVNDSIQNPDVININPSDGGTISPDTDLTILFSKDIDASTLESSIIITSTEAPGTSIHKKISYNAGDLNIATVTPAYDGLARNGAKFSVHISNGVKDKEGRHLYTPITYSYNIGINSESPRVEITSPDCSEEINSDKRIALIFSNNVKIGTGAIKVKQNDVDISNQVSIIWHDPQNRGSSHILRIAPTSPYLPGASIEVQLIDLKSPEGFYLEGKTVFNYTVK